MIDKFSGDNAFLSNFYESPIMYEGIEFPTVEHAFQAAKTTDIGQRQAIAALDTPGKAKRAGRKVNLRNNWESIKIGIMTDLVATKFETHEDLLDKLAATGSQELVEGNNWNDTFWGVCRGKGRNELGKILMRVRSCIEEDEVA